jgi:phage regulator Rha-like protein
MATNIVPAILTSDTVSMTSREIAELVGSNHADVRRSVERLAERGVITLPPSAEVSNDGPGPKTIKVFVFTGPQGKRDSIVVVAQLSPEFTACLVDRWQALEANLAPALPQDYPAALRALADETEARLLLEGKNRALQQQLETDKPYSELAKAITGQSTMTRRDWCAILKDDHGTNVTEKWLTQWLLDNRYIYRDKLDNTPRAYAGFSRYFKLEMHQINGYPRKVLMVTGTGVFELTPKVLVDAGKADAECGGDSGQESL